MVYSYLLLMIQNNTSSFISSKITSNYIIKKSKDKRRKEKEKRKRKK